MDDGSSSIEFDDSNEDYGYTHHELFQVFKKSDLERVYAERLHRSINRPLIGHLALKNHYEALCQTAWKERDNGTTLSMLDMEYQYLALGDELDLSDLTAALQPDNEAKNRFRAVSRCSGASTAHTTCLQLTPPDSTRVVLSRVGKDKCSDYINANFVDSPLQKKAYVLAQGPLPNTVNDFWRMIFEHKLSVVVCLTCLIESGSNKCALYWPNSKKSTNELYGNLDVNLHQQILEEEVFERHFTITHKTTKESFEVKHFQFRQWPDHGVPQSTDALLAFMSRVDAASDQRPMLIHCSAGVGRSGTFFVIHALLAQYHKEMSINVLETLIKARQQRPSLVQTVEQYDLVYRALIDSLCK